MKLLKKDAIKLRHVHYFYRYLFLLWWRVKSGEWRVESEHCFVEPTFEWSSSGSCRWLVGWVVVGGGCKVSVDIFCVKS